MPEVLRVGIVVPSSADDVVEALVRGLGQRGHDCSLWALEHGFGDWTGADVAVATGWETVHPVLGLASDARALLVLDHDPEHDESYRRGLHCIAAGAWLFELMTKNYGATATLFEPGSDDAAEQVESGLFEALMLAE